MEHETIDYFLEEIKTGKTISRDIKGTEREIRDKKIKFDETDVEICKILKEDSDSSLVAIQGIMSFVVTVSAMYISCMDEINDIISSNVISIKELTFLIIPAIVAAYSIYEICRIKRINKESIRLRNKTIAALIQMKTEKNKKEIDKNEKNA